MATITTNRKERKNADPDAKRLGRVVLRNRKQAMEAVNTTDSDSDA
jgi:hypothetical protein